MLLDRFIWVLVTTLVVSFIWLGIFVFNYECHHDINPVHVKEQILKGDK